MDRKFRTKMIKKVLLYYPYGKVFQRGEDRCQRDVEHASVMVLREAIDLGYMGAVLLKMGLDVMIKDYMGEKKSQDDFINDLKAFNPDLIVCSVTTATLLEDLKTFSLSKKILPGIITVAKGAYFYTARFTKENSLAFGSMDYALIGECEIIIDKLIQAINRQEDIRALKGVAWKNKDIYISNGPADFIDNLDDLPFPKRDLLNNKLYIRPDTGQPQATIQVSRGCPHKCTFCLTPIISGKTIRFRSVENIIKEIEECVHIYGIKNFFFRGDTFTLRQDVVCSLCDKIVEKGLSISWVANSRVKPIDYNMLKEMKKAGCWLIAFGIESGSEETLKHTKKEITTNDAANAVKLAKKAGLKIYGFFIIGFPWETKENIEETIAFAKQLRCDYSEFHICSFFEGTELHSEALRDGLLEDYTSSAGINYFTQPKGTKYISSDELLNLRKKALKTIYLSPKYIFKKFLSIRSLRELYNYLYYGHRLLKNIK